MAIREITYTLSPSGISPAAEQFGGVQGDHRATKLTFKFNGDLVAALNAYNNLHFRFDAYDGEGNVCQTEGELSANNSLEYFLEERLTRAGGKVAVVLVCTQVKDSAETELELYNFPALLRLKNKPQGNGETSENRESYTTLLEAAKNAAKQAKASENNANGSANLAAQFSQQSEFAANTAEEIATKTAERITKEIALETLDSKMDKFGEVTETDELIEVDLENLTEDYSSKPIRFRFGQNAYFESLAYGMGFKFAAGDNVVEVTTGGKSGLYFNGMPLHNVEVYDGAEDTDVANVGYVNKMCIPERITTTFDSYQGLENNKEYIASNPISNVEFGYSYGSDIICSLIFTTAAEGTINITFPEGTKFIGAKPAFGNGETWELNIKNGVVVGGKVV